MSPQTLLTRHPETIATEIDGDVVLMSLVTGRTYGLDKRASRIWALLESPRSIEAIVAELLKSYATTAEKCQADLIEFARKLSEAQLTLASEPAGAR
ncbi:MAG TPA: PqqD family protein [Opitutaceae bacterium]|nr:PqqD family protein [Opitutaceae bacterium]